MKFQKLQVIALCITLIGTMAIGTVFAQAESSITKDFKGDSEGKDFVSHKLTITNEEFEKMNTTDGSTKPDNTLTSKTSSLPYSFHFQLYPDQSVRTKGIFTGQTGFTVSATAYTTGGDPDTWYYNVDLLKKVWYGWTTVASSWNINYGYDSCSFTGCSTSSTYCINFFNPSESIQVWVDEGDGIVSAN